MWTGQEPIFWRNPLATGWAETGEERSPLASDRPCPACGRTHPGLEDCELLRPGSASPAGRCEIFRRIARTARRYIHLRYPERGGDLDDAIQEVWMRLSRQCGSGNAPPGGPVFWRWLRTVVFNCLTDLLRRERVVAKKRCGACAHFHGAGSRGCGKTVIRDPSLGREIENPWFGEKVGAETSPDALDPPCREFFWRYRPRGIEEVERELEAPATDPAALAEPPGAEALAALARLVRRGPETLRRASVVYRHYVKEEGLESISRSLGITARTARRDLQRALVELREILESP